MIILINKNKCYTDVSGEMKSAANNDNAGAIFFLRLFVFVSKSKYNHKNANLTSFYFLMSFVQDSPQKNLNKVIGKAHRRYREHSDLR